MQTPDLCRAHQDAGSNPTCQPLRWLNGQQKVPVAGGNVTWALGHRALERVYLGTTSKLQRAQGWPSKLTHFRRL